MISKSNLLTDLLLRREKMRILSQETGSWVLAIIRDGGVLGAVEVEIFKVVRELELFWNGVIVV